LLALCFVEPYIPTLATKPPSGLRLGPRDQARWFIEDIHGKLLRDDRSRGVAAELGKAGLSANCQGLPPAL
jgi:hypothetical protein